MALNALLGLGTALAPVFIALFIGIGFWWGLPSFCYLSDPLLLLFSLPLKLPGGNIKILIQKTRNLNIPLHFWIFATFALLYGIIETLNGNWLSIYMSKQFACISSEYNRLALTAFWGMVTIGRIFFAMLSGNSFDRISITFRIFPFVDRDAFLYYLGVAWGPVYWAIAAFGLTGFGCSALLPLSISFGSQ